MNDPIVQNRRAVGDGGERVIPPARTQCFSKSTRDFALSAARKPRVTAMMASVSVSVSVSGTKQFGVDIVQLMSEDVAEYWSMTVVLRGWFVLDIRISCSLESSNYVSRSLFPFKWPNVPFQARFGLSSMLLPLQRAPVCCVLCDLHLHLERSTSPS